MVSFTTRLNALNTEIVADPVARPSAGYVPDPQTVSGLLFQRFRPESRPAVDAWLTTRPLINPDAAPTPFALPEYRLATADEADRLAARADELAAQARQASQRSDNYVLTAVVFALVLFFAGLSGRAKGALSRRLLFGLAVVVLIGTLITLSLFPVEI